MNICCHINTKCFLHKNDIHSNEAQKLSNVLQYDINSETNSDSEKNEQSDTAKVSFR